MRQWILIALAASVAYLLWALLWSPIGASVEPFQAPLTVIALPTTIKCPTQQFGTGKQFLCESEEDATALITGPTNKTQTYLGPLDQVCVTDDKESKIYTCKDLNQSPDDPNEYRFQALDNYDTTCNNIVKNFLDISGNLASLNAMKDVVVGSTTGVETARTNLNNLYLNMKCALMTASGRSKTICDAIKSGMDELNKNGALTDATLKQVTDPIQKMIDSRSALKKNVDDFRCEL
jgi:hypothetical protein